MIYIRIDSIKIGKLIINQVWNLFIAWIICVNYAQGREWADRVYDMTDHCGLGGIYIAEYTNYRIEVKFDTKDTRKKNCQLEIQASDYVWKRIAFQCTYIFNYQQRSCLLVKQGTGNKFKAIYPFGESFCKRSTPIPTSQQFVTETENILLLNYTRGDTVSENFSFTMTASLFGSFDYCQDYKCDNGRCIPNKLNCHGDNPCGDNSDCDKNKNVLSTIEIFGIVAGVVAGVVACVSVCVCYVKARNRASRNEDLELSNQGYEDEIDLSMHQQGHISYIPRPNYEPRVTPPSAPSLHNPINNRMSRSDNNLTDSVTDTRDDHRRRTNTFSGNNDTPLGLPPSYDDVIANSDVYKVTTSSTGNLNT